MITPEHLAELFHNTYREVCEDIRSKSEWIPSGSRAWDEVPSLSKKVFVEICRRILIEMEESEHPINPKYPPWKK